MDNLEILLKQFKKNLKDTGRYWRYGLKGFPFSTDIDVDQTIGRDNELGKISILISDMVQGAIPSITILGYKGVGKSHFLKALFNILEKMYKSNVLEYRPILITNYEEFEKYHAFAVLNEEDKKFMLLIDDTGTVWNRSNDKLMSLYNNRNIKIISVWHHASWGNAKKHHESPTPRTQTEILDRLTDNDIYRILEFRIKKQMTSHLSKPFTNEALKIISENSNGVPYTALVLAGKCLFLALENNKLKHIDEEVVRECLSKMGMELKDSDRTKIEDLTIKQKIILKKILELSTSGNRELSATDISKNIQYIQRAGIAKHLRMLEKAGILDSKKIGVKRLYQIKPKYMRVCEDVILGGNIEYSL